MGHECIVAVRTTGRELERNAIESELLRKHLRRKCAAGCVESFIGVCVVSAGSRKIAFDRNRLRGDVAACALLGWFQSKQERAGLEGMEVGFQNTVMHSCGAGLLLLSVGLGS